MKAIYLKFQPRKSLLHTELKCVKLNWSFVLKKNNSILTVSLFSETYNSKKNKVNATLFNAFQKR